jgi:hypothetical protein
LLKCAPAKETFTFNQPSKVETWHNLANVKYSEKTVVAEWIRRSRRIAG